MSTGNFANETGLLCTAPLLDEGLFPKKGGYQAGRYCGLGASKAGAPDTSCCFPCPIQDWVYPPEWKSHVHVPNHLSVLSVILCSFLLLSFLVLPPAQSHRHYLSIGLLTPVLLISLSFAIPISTKPDYCYDAITPAGMHDSMSCAWTGSLVTLGGLGCVIWVFLRSLWLFVRIVYDVAPGRRFMYGSIATGTLLPIVLLIAVLTGTGYSYRMGQTCLPNRENAMVTFWIWLVIFAILGFLLQAVTTGYCLWIYIRTLRRERSNASGAGDGQARQRRANLQTWTNVKKLFVLQWRNILVSIFVLIGSLTLFIVFWTQDSRLGSVFNNPESVQKVRTWLICRSLSTSDQTKCRKYVQDFTVDESAVLTSLVLASLLGVEIFILLFRRSMIQGWLALFHRLAERAGSTWGPPPTPELTSLGNPDKYSFRSLNQRLQDAGFTGSFDTIQTRVEIPIQDTSRRSTRTTSPPPPPRSASPPPPPPPPAYLKPKRPCPRIHPQTPSTCSSEIFQVSIPEIHIVTPSTPSPASSSERLTPKPPPPLIARHPRRLPPSPPNRSTTSIPSHRYHPTRAAPTPPGHSSESLNSSTSMLSIWSNGTHGTSTERSWRDSTISALEKVAKEDEQFSGRQGLVFSVYI